MWVRGRVKVWVLVRGKVRLVTCFVSMARSVAFFCTTI
jgi:hypothetical protein